MILGYISLTHDGKGLSSCTRLQALDLIAYNTLMARRFPNLGILSIYTVFILDQWDIFYWCLEINTSSTTPFY
jgi:hypothetical protein